ncbi:AGE family epimerase/isomerase [bacterium]|nr:AGE family epimerase/isomerase [bacterium]
MNRRNFFGTSLAAGLTGTASLYAEPAAVQTNYKMMGFKALPEKIAGMSYEELRDDYRDRLFKQFLPFWDKGGYDKTRGGFVTELRDDGSIETDEKYIWYQGRGIWVYSYLYNNFGKDPKFLEIAKKSRDFMVKYMYRGNGMWEQMVYSDGKPKDRSDQGSGADIYGPMFAVAGLIEYFRAAGNEEDLEILKTTIWKSVERYNNPDYPGVTVPGITKTGLRAQGHSFMMVWTLTQLLEFHSDPKIDALVREHVDHVLNDFWNQDYGISNETLFHDYTHIPSESTHFSPGHSIETLWMVMREALREKNGTIFYTCKGRIRRILEMAWDYVYEGLGDTEYFVFGSPEQCAGGVFDMKTMWAHCEVLVATMLTLEYTGDAWALEWYERARAFTLRTMPTACGVWRQGVDRFGADKQRPGISIYRKGNFHQPRYMVYNLQSLEHIIQNKGKLTAFPL